MKCRAVSDTRWDISGFKANIENRRHTFSDQRTWSPTKTFGEILRIIRPDLELAKFDHLKLQTSAENLAHVNTLQNRGILLNLCL